MKKNILSLAVSFGFAVFVNAQEVAVPVTQSEGKNSNELTFTSMNGHEVLPQSGEFCLGVGAAGLTQYFGNLFGFQNSNSVAPFNYAAKTGFPSAVIYGKYFVSSSTAYRASLSIQSQTVSQTSVIADEASDDPDAYLVDMYTRQASAVVLGGGLEKRRGASRVQGVYGVEGHVSYETGAHHTFEYANQITEANQVPLSTPYTAVGVTLPVPAQGQRIVKASTGSNFGVGVRGFVGVEYFFAPKMSIGGEFNWGVALTNLGEQKVVYEGWEAASSKVVHYTVSSKQGGSFIVNTGNVGGLLNLLFYF